MYDDNDDDYDDNDDDDDDDDDDDGDNDDDDDDDDDADDEPWNASQRVARRPLKPRSSCTAASTHSLQWLSS